MDAKHIFRNSHYIFTCDVGITFNSTLVLSLYPINVLNIVS